MRGERSAAVALMLESRVICGLSLLESLSGSLDGVGCLSDSEVVRLRLWAGRWRRVSPTVRSFYSLQVGTDLAKKGIAPAVDRALWAILHGGERRRRVSAGDYSTLRSLWVDSFGLEPSFELVPIFGRFS